MLWKDSAYRVEIVPPELVREGQMWNSMHVFTFETNSSTLNTFTHNAHVLKWAVLSPVACFPEAYIWDFAEMWTWHIFLKCFESIKSSWQQYRRCMRQKKVLITTGSWGYQPTTECNEKNENCFWWPAIVLELFNCHADCQQSYLVSILCFSTENFKFKIEGQNSIINFIISSFQSSISAVL